MIESRVVAADVYTDVSGLNALKGQARDDEAGALREIARQFESLLLAQVLKSMRSANQVFAEGGFLQSNETKFYEQMFDSQLTLALTKGRSLGLADAMVNQLQSGHAPAKAEAESRGTRLDIRDYPRTLPALKPELPARLQDVIALDHAPAEQSERQNDELHSDRANVAPLRDFTSPANFVAQLMPIARNAAAELGVDPRVLVAQAALETGWGKHMIEAGDGSPSHNLFGIKADARWSGEAVTVTTTEFREGVPLKEKASFRAYPDFGASFADYVNFLQQNPRYRQALESASDPAAFTDALQDAGYATDPHYSNKIQNIVEGRWIQSGLQGDARMDGNREVPSR